MRLRWDQTLMPPPSLARSAAIRRAGEAADETFAEARDEEQEILHAVSSDRVGANSQKLCQLTVSSWPAVMGRTLPLGCTQGRGNN